MSSQILTIHTTSVNTGVRSARDVLRREKTVRNENIWVFPFHSANDVLSRDDASACLKLWHCLLAFPPHSKAQWDRCSRTPGESESKRKITFTLMLSATHDMEEYLINCSATILQAQTLNKSTLFAATK